MPRRRRRFLPRRPTPSSPPSRRRRPHRRRALPLRHRALVRTARGVARLCTGARSQHGRRRGEADGDGGSSRSFRALQTIVMLRSDHDTVLHWATQSEPAGEWKQPPQGWVSVPANSWGTGGRRGRRRWSPPRRAGRVRGNRGARGRGRRRLRHRTADKSHWVKDDGQDFMVYFDEARSNADVRAPCCGGRRRRPTGRRSGGATSKSKKKSLAAGGSSSCRRRCRRSQPWWCAKIGTTTTFACRRGHRLGGGARDGVTRVRRQHLQR